MVLAQFASSAKNIKKQTRVYRTPCHSISVSNLFAKEEAEEVSFVKPTSQVSSLREDNEKTFTHMRSVQPGLLCLSQPFPVCLGLGSPSSGHCRCLARGRSNHLPCQEEHGCRRYCPHGGDSCLRCRCTKCFVNGCYHKVASVWLETAKKLCLLGLIWIWVGLRCMKSCF